jgi:starch synthase
MAAIFYHPEAYSIGLSKLMGRNAAGHSFLDGFFRYSRAENAIFAQVASSSHAADFEERAKRYARTETIQCFTNNDLIRASEADVLYFPGPGIGDRGNERRLFSDTAWSLCGITHTTSSARAMDDITSWVTSPVQPWDAVICTSTAVKQNVETALQAEVDALRDRLGITKLVLPQLPVIPLGINTEDFAFTLEQRAAARNRLSASENTVVLLYTGRLSFHAKAHPLAMYQALEAAVNSTGKDLILVECGWHGNEHIGAAFSAAARLACPSVRTVTLDGRLAEDRETAWASADIFCSLPDNIQETFGIVPVEAMAAGLPVVVSDWNGYKDTVREGIDGFRIPTIAPGPGLAGDLAHRHALELDTYDMYCGHSSSLVAIHIRKLCQAFIDLIQSPDLRKKMGRAGRLRATSEYDWRAIIPRYEELWDEQNNIRLSAKRLAADSLAKGRKTESPQVWPARLDPTIAFANYPSEHLTLSTRLTLTEPTAEDAKSRLGEYKDLAMVNYASFVFPTEEEIALVFERAGASFPDSCSAEDLLRDIEPSRRPYVLRGLAWLCKLGLLEF